MASRRCIITKERDCYLGHNESYAMYKELTKSKSLTSESSGDKLFQLHKFKKHLALRSTLKLIFQQNIFNSTPSKHIIDLSKRIQLMQASLILSGMTKFSPKSLSSILKLYAKSNTTTYIGTEGVLNWNTISAKTTRKSQAYTGNASLSIKNPAKKNLREMLIIALHNKGVTGQSIRIHY